VVDRKREAVWHDADDGRRCVSKLHRLSDDVGASSEPLAPHVVAKDDHRRCAGLLVGVEQRPSNERRHTNELKGRRGDLGDRHWLRSRVAENHIALDRAIRAEIHDGSHVALPNQEVVKHAPLVSAAGDIAHLDLDDAIAVRERNRRPQQVARQVVPAGADADGNGERQPARDGQARILQQHPQPQLVVLQHIDRFHSSSSGAHANEGRRHVHDFERGQQPRLGDTVSTQVEPVNLFEIANHIVGLARRREAPEERGGPSSRLDHDVSPMTCRKPATMA
jgi:hypothetical protein